MRLHEIVARSLDGIVETVVLPASDPAADEGLAAALRLPSVPVAAGAPAAGPRLLVVPVGDAREPSAALAPLADATASRVLLTVATPPSALPLGPLVDALVDGGWAVREALLVEHPVWSTAVVADRLPGGEVPALHAYLDPGRAVPLEGRALLRLLDEHVVEGLVARARLDALQAERDALAAEAAVLRADTVHYRETPDPAAGPGGSVASKVGRRVRRIAGR